MYMCTELVKPSSAIEMIGAYLAAKPTCPFCNKENVLVHIEGYTSPVKTVDVCKHLTAHEVIEGESHFEFKHEPERH